MSSDETSQKLGEMLTQIRNNFQGAVKAIDTYINFLGKPQSNPEHPEVYEKLNWETRTGNKGEYQLLRKDNCNNTQLFTHLENILHQNKSNILIGDYHYWAGDQGYIFRRKRKTSK